MVKVSISINVAQVPNLTELILVESCLDKNLARRLSVQEATCGSQGFKGAQQPIGRILQSPGSSIYKVSVSKCMHSVIELLFSFPQSYEKLTSSYLHLPRRNRMDLIRFRLVSCQICRLAWAKER